MSTDVEIVSPDADAPPQIPAQSVPSARLIATLAVAGALAALLLSFVYEVTKPLIDANKAAVLREAVAEVLKDPAAVTSLVVEKDGLVPDETTVYLEEKGVERVYLGYADEAKTKPIGFALKGGAYGYGSDPIMSMSPLQVLRQALSALGQPCPGKDSIDDLWHWALTNWKLSNIPAVRELVLNPPESDQKM